MNNRSALLKELRTYGIQNNVPNISDTNAHFLQDLITTSKATNILEIGTANGFSTIHLGIASEKLHGKVTSIDFSPHSFSLAQNNIKKALLESTVTLIFGDALNEIPKIDDTFDFIFIDGMMRRTVDFLGLVWNKTAIGGIIIIDDVIKFKDKMTGLDDFLKQYNIKYNILPLDIDDGVMMIIKDNIHIEYNTLSH